MRVARALTAAVLIALECSHNAAAASLTAWVRSTAGVPVEDAALVLYAIGRKPQLVPSRATIEQRDREFRPYLTIVTQGAEIEFPNRDPVKHHVYSFSPPNIFEIKLYADKPAKPIVFEKIGNVVLGCNIHDWMEAHVLIVDTPWFAKTGADGRATITGLPAGSYRLRLWHPRQQATVAEREVVLKGARATSLELTIAVAPRAVAKKPPLDADGY